MSSKLVPDFLAAMTTEQPDMKTMVANVIGASQVNVMCFMLLPFLCELSFDYLLQKEHPVSRPR